jgi:peptide chain release factor 1
MFSKLDDVEKRYEQVQMMLQRPDIASDQKQYRGLMKELSDLEKVVTLYRDFRKKTQVVDGNKKLLGTETDSEMKDLLKEEIKEIEQELPQLELSLKLSLIASAII